MSLNYEKIKNWPITTVRKRYTREEMARIASGFGAGLPGPLQEEDARFIQIEQLQALPMAAVALADGEFWQMDPELGLQWKKTVHAGESITVHRPLPVEGELVVKRWVEDVYDRGADRGALIIERQQLSDAQGQPYITIVVSTVLRGDGGFGGKAEPPRERLVFPDRAPDDALELKTPLEEGAVFRLPRTFDVTSGCGEDTPTQSMLRGLCSFGIAGRAVLKLCCENAPARLRKFSVRYAGPMFTEETVRAELWRVGPGRAVFLLRAIERNALVLNNCYVEFDE